MTIPSGVHRTFPGLAADGSLRSSPVTDRYNCIAFAAGKRDVNWWPIPSPVNGWEWPLGYGQPETLASFQAAFGTLGYIPCADGSLEPGFEKIVFYEIAGRIKHAARQTSQNHWLSKLGPNIDITHFSEVAVESEEYGTVAGFMKRPLQAAPEDTRHSPESASVVDR